MKLPLVSVVIPTYNRAELLPRAVDSVIAQTVSDWEVIIVDDGSTDQTPLVAERYRRSLGRRLAYHFQDHQGASRARNTGIDACRGRFVAFLDSDDEFFPSKLERQIELFHLRPELGLVYSDYAYIDLDGQRRPSAFDDKCPAARRVSRESVAPGLFVCGGDFFGALLCDYFVATIVGMVRRDVLGSHIRFPTEHAYAEEWLFYLRVARVCRAGFVDEPLSLHHFVPGSAARTDPHRNLVRLRGLLHSIESEFPDLTRDQRRAVRGRRAETARQLAYNAMRARQARLALAFLAETVRLRPTWRGLLEWAKYPLEWAVAGRSTVPAGRPISQ